MAEEDNNNEEPWPVGSFAVQGGTLVQVIEITGEKRRAVQFVQSGTDVVVNGYGYQSGGQCYSYSLKALIPVEDVDALMFIRAAGVATELHHARRLVERLEGDLDAIRRARAIMAKGESDS